MIRYKLVSVKILFIIVFFVTSISSSMGQLIKIQDLKNQKPVEGAIVQTEKYIFQSDSAGIVILKGINRSEKFLILHPSFQNYITTLENITRMGGYVFLTESPLKINEIVVSVNRWEQWKSELPVTVSGIPANEIFMKNPQSTADLVGYNPGVFVQKSQMGGGSPMIRGFSANRLLIVVDGIRMNNAIFRSGNLHNVISVDPLSLESSEIIYGPGTVVYGSDALGGVMSFNTLNPRFSSGLGFNQTGKAYVKYSSANFEKKAHLSYSLGSSKWAALISATFTDFDNLKMGSNGPDDYLRKEYVINQKFDGYDNIGKSLDPKIQKYTAYNQHNILSKFRYRFSDDVELNLSLNHSQTSDIPRYDRLIFYKSGKLRYAEWYYGPQKWNMFAGQVLVSKKQKIFDKNKTTFAFQNYEESRHDRLFNSPTLSHRTEMLDIFSINSDFLKELNKKSILFYGAEFTLNRVISTGIAENLSTLVKNRTDTRYPNNSHYQSIGFYASYNHRFSEKFDIQTGLRFTNTSLNGDFDKSFFDFPFSSFNTTNSSLIGNLGMVWNPIKTFNIKLLGSTGFRSPNIDDVAKVFESTPGKLVIPNPDLQPEYSKNVELTLKKIFFDKIDAEVTGFFTLLDGAMVRRDTDLNGKDSVLYNGVLSKIQTYVNTGWEKIKGLTFTLDFEIINKLRLKSDYTLMRGFDSDGFPARHVPPDFGSTHLIFTKPKLVIDFYCQYSARFNYEDLAPTEIEKAFLYLPDKNGNPYSPSWTTLNFKMNYKVSKNMVISTGIENLTDKRYRTYSSGITAPGIDVSGSILYSF